MGRGNSIRLRADGRYEGQITVNGLRRSAYGATAKEAADKLARLRIDSGLAFSDGENMRLEEFLRFWLDGFKAKVDAGERSWKTYRSYKMTVDNYLIPYLGGRTLKQLIPGDILRLQAALRSRRAKDGTKDPVPPHSIAYACGVLKIAVRTAVFPSQFIRTNPFQDVRLEKPKAAEWEPWTAEQFLAVYAAAVARGDRLALLYYLGGTTGLRHAELLALRGSSFDAKEGTVRVEWQLLEKHNPHSFELVPPKSDASKAVLACPPEVIAAVRAHQLKLGLKPDDFLFMTQDGTHYSQPRVLKHFRKSVKRAEKDLKISIPPITIHDLRHSCATLLLEAGKDLKDIQIQLRHEDFSLTAKTYAHVTKRKARKTADAMSEIIRGIQ